MTLIVGENLRQLTVQQGICPERYFDGTSLKVLLGDTVLRPTADKTRQVTYEMDNYQSLYSRETLEHSGLLLVPGSFVIACSLDEYRIPKDCVGMLSGKRTLDSLGIASIVGANRVDPGWSGRLNLTMANNGPFSVWLRRGSTVGSLELWRASSSFEYHGRHEHLEAPTGPVGE